MSMPIVRKTSRRPRKKALHGLLHPGTLPYSGRAEGAGGRAGLIYCTLITAKLVHQQLKVAPPLPPLPWQYPTLPAAATRRCHPCSLC